MTSTGLTVAVTGPTGDLGLSIVDALERSRAVKRIIGMARRPFDPAERGWRKTEYRQGDVTDAASVRDLVKDAHVVVHLAFAILDASDATRDLNVEGSRRVFEEAVKAGAERICYASSVAAYGFHDENPDWLTEDIPARGSPEYPYSQPEGRGGAGARGHAAQPPAHDRLRVPALHRRRPRGAHDAAGDPLLPARARRCRTWWCGCSARCPALKPVIPDPGTRFQLVHSEDVARAFVAGVRGVGEPGPYNLAGGGTLTFSHLAVGARLVLGADPEAGGRGDRRDRRPPAVGPGVGRLAALGAQAGADEDGSGQEQLKWRPQHTARRTMEAMVRAQREDYSALR